MSFEVNITLPHAPNSPVQFSTPKHSISALFGPSGAGKTSLLHAIAGLIHPTSGTIKLGESLLFHHANKLNLSPQKRALSYAFQEPRLFPHLSVNDNISYSRPGHRNRADAQKTNLCEHLALTPLLKRKPRALSGGERQRVALARALLRPSDALLLDEPLTALDATLRGKVLSYLHQQHRAQAKPTLYVSHQLTEILHLADHMVVLKNGTVAAQGPVATLLSTPELTPLFGETEAGALLTAELLEHENDGLARLRVAAGHLLVPGLSHLKAKQQCRLRLRARDITLSHTRPQGMSALNTLPARIQSLHQHNTATCAVRLDCAGDPLLCHIPQRARESLTLQPGTKIWAMITALEALTTLP